ncbi:family 20 glycosylhydrolase [Echinicola sp. CAU 1574]|uniref:beta-N-acetylhexosaminidase n=1 Tax=Echinicola arenosa TaxID=2774144 RepID=A0ABR9AN20_9BACT|nr:family 20 glycosylhydrolase [Echinicola arenosa]MBD8489004.1 family 20 glycosylhydrolase [Echinicola arenosa]
MNFLKIANVIIYYDQKVNLIALLCLIGGLFHLSNETLAQTIDFIPQPVEIKKGEGSFELNQVTTVFFDLKKLSGHAELLVEGLQLDAEIKHTASLSSSADNNYIKLALNPTLSKEHKGKYLIRITNDMIAIEGGDEEAIVNAIYRLVQLSLIQENRYKLPSLSLIDYPRFDYRGFHLDVSRNYFPISFLEKLIDMMAIYQLNTFHWHLTDGPGWRLEIKSYPKLTQIAAFRSHRTWKEWWNSERKFLSEGDPQAYGGYYTQEEAKHLVDYALKRGITIIPEIEMPGHSGEVLAVYPELACSGKPYTQSEFCMGNEQTFEFFEKVLGEVAAIFPSEYIHIGGDEANKRAWRTCSKCQQRIKALGLKDEDELQSYGVKRVGEILEKLDRKFIGWDEILEGGLAPGAAVMSWRGESGGIKAAQSGHEVIMTPGEFCYFDKYQTNPATQPEAIGGYIPIEKVYGYDPIPTVLKDEEKGYVMGVQANLWTEYIPTTEHAEYMIFPRLLALSEVAWTTNENKDWDGFFERLQSHYRLLQRRGINYYHPIPNLNIEAKPYSLKKASLVKINSERFGATIKYTLDGSPPNRESPTYSAPFYQIGTPLVKAAMLYPSGEMGPVTEMELAYHLGVGAKVTYHQPFSRKYPAQGISSLVNGQKGSFTYGDGEWQGFEGKDLDVTVALSEIKKVSQIKARFMQLTGPGVYLPKRIFCSWSKDGEDFSDPVEIINEIPESDSSLIIHPFVLPVNAEAKYFRITAKVNKGFLFADELLFY